MRPKLIIIQGAPASGKTTISHHLVQRLDDVLLVSKDGIKEFLFDTQPTGDRDWSRVLGKASIGAMYEIAKVFLASGRHVILESAFHPLYAREDIQKLNADVLEIYCHCNTEELIKRFKIRASTDRHPGHLDDRINYDVESIKQFQPINVGTLATIDTTKGVNKSQYNNIVRNIKLFLKEV
ncbi:hypothetical protein D3C73_16690 [compost metagenome]